MADKTGISWTDATWNPIRGCSKVSAGCKNCYAEKVAARFSGPGAPYEGTIRDGRWNGNIRLVPEMLAQPLKWKRPRRIFVNSMSDLFHEAVPFEFIAAVFGVMAACPQHTFQVLTKRPERAVEFFAWASRQKTYGGVDVSTAESMQCIAIDRYLPDAMVNWPMADAPWPLPNVHLGVSVEDQPTADERIPLLLQCPAAVRFVSYEPALGPVDLSPFIGYNSPHDGETQRSGCLRDGQGRDSGDRPRGQDLEDCHSRRGQVDGWRPTEQVPAQASGEQHRGRVIPAGQGDDRQGPSACSSAPTGVVPPPRRDPARADDQSQERSEIGQPAGEPGVGHVPGELGSCGSHSPGGQHASPVGAVERISEVDDRAGGGDRAAPGVGRETQRARVGVRGGVSDNIQDREGRAAPFWLIVGGESGPNARPFDVAWARSTIEQCRAAGVSCFVKQVGAHPWDGLGSLWGIDPTMRSGVIRLRDRAGADPAEWPEDLRVQEFPEVAT